MTTIAWRLGHLVEGLASMNGVYFGGPRVDPDTYDTGSAATTLARLDEEYAAWVAGVRGLGEAGLAEPQGDRSPPAFADAPVARVVLYTSVELIHHGAEVCLLRDLWVGSAELRR
ncbi:DinB family protein [Nocardioides zhouii]|uniref:DinB family protein n=1 Tax=Nocardioides zhouii TaxID=1168729 RepID=UPI001F5D1D8D|nr:DinB family protein [Nocardioides zhouii]